MDTFALKLSEYLDKEIAGSYYSKDGAEKTTHMAIGKYEGNSFDESTTTGDLRYAFLGDDKAKAYALKDFFHTHPSVGLGEKSRQRPSDPDLIERDASLLY